MNHKSPAQVESFRLPRREFIREAATAVVAAGLSPVAMLGCQLTSSRHSSASGHIDAMDQALEMMAGLGPMTNHGPMAAEALISLGRADHVITFVDAYRQRFTSSRPPSYQAVTSQNWRDALGDGRRAADWTRFFNHELKEAAWPQVLEKWSAVLAPGLAAAAAHGLIRTAHAVHSLSVKESDLRRRELAEGMGYWAAYYQKLPETQRVGAQKLKPAQAIARVPLLPAANRGGGSIMVGLRGLDKFAPFADAANLIETTGKPEQLISELTASFADAYLRNITPRNVVTLIHTITSTSGLRSLVPYLSTATTQEMLRYGWQVAAGLYSIAGIGSTNSVPAAQEVKIDNLIERAVATKEEHAIKFTAACLREFSHNPNQIYLLAAQDALGRIRAV